MPELDAGARELEVDGDRVLAAAVAGAESPAGTLALLPRLPFGPYDETALDHVASLVAVELLRGEQLRLAEERLRADLLRDALAALGPAEDLAARARALGIDLDEPHVAVTAGVDDLDAALSRVGRGRRRAREAAVRLWWRRSAPSLGAAALVGRDGDAAVALVPAAALGDLRERLEAAAAALAHAEPGLVLAAGWGRAAVLGAHGRSLGEARRARALGAALRAGGAHGYEDVAVYDALLGEGAPPAARELAEHTLGPLSASCGARWRSTCRAACPSRRTADALFLHRTPCATGWARSSGRPARRLDVLEDRLVLEIGVVAARLGR